jgi:hypothetical protein
MIQNQYYYLVAGLPELLLDADNRKFDFVAARSWLKENLKGEDLELFDALSLHYDNENFVSHLNNRSSFSDRGLVPVEAYEDVKANLHQFPTYIAELYKELNAAKSEDDEEQRVDDEDAEPEKRVEVNLYNRFYCYVAKYGNEFLQKWFEFDLQLRNILAATNARKLGKDPSPYLVGTDPINQHLAHNISSDFGLRGELPLMEKLMPILEISNIYEREKRLDMLRWEFIDEVNIFSYFNIDKVLGYYLKAEIVDRWMKFDPKVGDVLLNRYFNELKGTFDLNAAFEEQ